MNEEAQFVFVETMGHGPQFVAEVVSSELIPGTTQFNVLRGDGSIERTIGMCGSAIFRWTSVSKEDALKLAGRLEQARNIYNVTLPERLLLEAQSSRVEPLPIEREGDEDGDDDDEF